MTFRAFDQIRLDALREISSIATGNAATSLSTMLGKKVDITIPNVEVETLGKVPDLLGGWDKIVSVIHFYVKGQVKGSILLVLSSSETLRLVNVLTGQKPAHIESLDYMGISALKELGNIVAGSYIRVLAQGLKIKMTYSIPGFAHDMLGAILDQILAQLSQETEHAVIMESEFLVREEVYRGYLIFILTPKAVSAIIESLGNWEK